MAPLQEQLVLRKLQLAMGVHGPFLLVSAI
jgi:hypothetical protein